MKGRTVGNAYSRKGSWAIAKHCTVIQMREHGLKRIYTADHDFKRFSEIEVINPLT